MNKLQKLTQQLERLTREFDVASAAILSQKVAVIKKRVVGCSSCHTAGQLRNWGFVQNYLQPTSRAASDKGGVPSETKMCHLFCPHCGELICIYDHHQRDLIVDLVDNHGFSKEEIFAFVWEKYGDDPPKRIFPKV